MKKMMVLFAFLVGFAFIGVQLGYAADVAATTTTDPKKVEEKTVKTKKTVKKGVISGKKARKEAKKAEEVAKKTEEAAKK